MSQVSSWKFISAKSAAGAGLLGVSLLGASAGCGGGSDDDTARLGLRDNNVNPQGAGGGGGEMGQAGTSAVGAAGAPAAPAVPVDPNAPSGAPQACTAMAAPELLIDFATYIAAGTWGDAARAQITGGTSLYSLAPNPNLANTTAEGALHLEGPIPAGAYAGIVLWFGPCVDASTYSGVQFAMTGELGASTLLVKMQTSPNYPVDVRNTKGQCPFTRDADKYTECQQPFASLTALDPNPLSFDWADFTGGVPNAALDPAQLLGFELQFQCQGTAECLINVNVGNVSFVP